MNEVFKSGLDFFIIFFIDDSLIFSKCREGHENHLRIVLGLLNEKQLYVKYYKYEFWLPSMLFLGHVILKEGLW